MTLTERKVELIINILPLIPALIKGTEEVREAYQRAVAALKDGVTDAELEDAGMRLDAEIARAHELLAQMTE